MTKADLAPDAARRDELRTDVQALLARTTLAGVPVLLASAQTGEGIDAVRARSPRSSSRRRMGSATARLAIDRVFAVRGRGHRRDGQPRGGRIAPGDTLRLVPGDARRAHPRGPGPSATVEAADRRPDRAPARRHRGRATSSAAPSSPPIPTSSRRPGCSWRSGVRPGSPRVPRPRSPTTAIGSGCTSGPTRSTRSSSVARASRSTSRMGACSRSSASRGRSLPRPATGSRSGSRRPARPRVAAWSSTRSRRAGSRAGASRPTGVRRRSPRAIRAARLDLHGALVEGDAVRLAPDVAASLRQAAIDAVRAHHAAEPSSPGLALPALRTTLAIRARRRATLDRTAAERVARHVVDQAIADGVLARDGDRLRDPDRAAGLPADVLAAMDRLEAALAVAAPPSLSAAARDAGCPPDGVKALERDKRIVRLEDDLAWATHDVAGPHPARAPSWPRRHRSPPPRSATRPARAAAYVLVLLEDLDRRGILRRTDAGHVLGPKTLERMRAHVAATADAP